MFGFAISRYLGKEYEVVASMGHIIDLPKNSFGVDVENGFKPRYEVIGGKEGIIKKIKDSSRGKEVIYLAADPDREGEMTPVTPALLHPHHS